MNSVQGHETPAVQAGPPADQVAEARSTTSAARTALASATERAATLNGPPAATAVREAEDKVAQAQATLARARAQGDSSPEIDPRARDAILVQKEIERHRTEHATRLEVYRGIQKRDFPKPAELTVHGQAA